MENVEMQTVKQPEIAPPEENTNINVVIKAEENICEEESLVVKSEQSEINELKDLETDPYAYLKRDEFCSERFKIEIKNLPKFYGIQQLRKLLNVTLNLNSSKIKTPRRNSSFAFIGFRNEEDREKALETLQDYMWKGTKLAAIKANPAQDPLVRKRRKDMEENCNKKSKIEASSVEESIKQSVTPLCDTPYEEQLTFKQNEVEQLLRKIGNELVYCNPNLKSWINTQKFLYSGLPCELLNIRHASNNQGYRNKCEFTIGINEETGLKSVGFRIGSYVEGKIGVGPIDNLMNIPESMKIASKIFEKFVRASSLDVYNPENQTGHLRQLAARSATDQLMLIVGVVPQSLSAEEIEKLKEELIQFFFHGEGKDANVTSLYFQLLIKKTKKEDDSSKPVHLYGETHIYETLLGIKFRISPEAFFQVNTQGAEIVYNTAIELAEAKEDSTVLDICCGTGTIGLCFSKTCSQVIGLEVNAKAIEDAKQNALENNITNAEFFSGKAEEILYSVFTRSKSDDVIAIIDPPRAGLHNKAVQTIRNLDKIKKLVYISCNPNNAMKNFTDFGKPCSKTMQGDPLVPVKAVAVDLFPHTRHFELIILFQRLDTSSSTEEINNVPNNDIK